MDTLTLQSLEWALTHVRKFGDTDIFPIPFEFDAIRHSWGWLRDEIVALDLAQYHVRPHRRTLVPKPDGGFRVAVQLDPIDTLVFTGLVYEVAEAIEQSRVSAEQRIACSYRVRLDPTGSFFGADNGWRDFHAHSTELATSSLYTHVLIADLADFYNQTNHHRIENALESAGISEERAKNIEGFLSSLAAKQSRGVPVGPYASIVLAEACLNDVDAFLIRKGRTHVRYVDDFRIFCRSRWEAISLLHDLTEYLYTSHRMSLQTGKTKIRTVDEFKQKEIFDPAEEEERGKMDRLRQLMEEIAEATGYTVYAEEDLDPLSVSQAVRDNLADLFLASLKPPTLNLGLAKYLLRRARVLRSSVLIPLLIDRLEILAPAFRDTALYITSAAGRKAFYRNGYGGQLMKFLRESDVGRLPFLRMWGLFILEAIPELVSREEAWALAEESRTDLGIRYVAQLARKHKLVDWVRGHKETWGNYSPWDRRSIIWSSSILPMGERKHWLDLVKGSLDPLDRAVAGLATSQ